MTSCLQRGFSKAGSWNVFRCFSKIFGKLRKSSETFVWPRNNTRIIFGDLRSWNSLKMQQVAREEKSCSKKKKLLEMWKVAKKVAEQLVESPTHVTWSNSSISVNHRNKRYRTTKEWRLFASRCSTQIPSLLRSCCSCCLCSSHNFPTSPT